MVDPLQLLLRAMQTGVAQMIALGNRESTLEALRAGLAATCVDHAALVAVLQENADFLPADVVESATMRATINCAMCNHGALVKCLLDAGVITLEQYEKARREVLQAEVQSYEQAISAIIGARVTLL